MAEEKKEVNEQVETSSTDETQEVVTESADTTQQESTEATGTQDTQTQTETGESQVEALDDKGVPWKNRAYEWQRKSEDLADKLPSMIQDAVTQSMGRHQPQQYSVEQLEAFALQTDNPVHQQWARSEIRKLERDEQAKVIRREMQKWRTTQEADIRKRDALNYVTQNYPEAFAKDAQGNNLGWNNNHPLTKMIGRLMQDPRLKNNPDGLAIASDIAYGRYARSQSPKSQKENKSLKREVKNLQKRTLVEGGGKDNVQSVPAHRAAIDKLKQTGSIRDAQAAIAAIAKARMESEE